MDYISKHLIRSITISPNLHRGLATLFSLLYTARMHRKAIYAHARNKKIVMTVLSQYPLIPKRISKPHRCHRKPNIRKDKAPPTEMKLPVRHARNDCRRGRGKEPEVQPPQKHGSTSGQ